MGEISDATDFIMVWVTEEGYPVPLRTSWESYYSWQNSATPNEPTESDSWEHRMDIYGEVDPALETKMHRMLMESAAAFFPAIPKWLAENPPVYCCFIPDGNVLVGGELGVGGDAKWRPGSANSLWQEANYLYSPEGELLDQTEPAQYWWPMYFPGWDEVSEKWEINTSKIVDEDKGFIEVLDEKWNRVALYSYLGEELPVDTDIDAIGPAWPDCYGRDLAVLYEIQQSLR